MAECQKSSKASDEVDVSLLAPRHFWAHCVGTLATSVQEKSNVSICERGDHWENGGLQHNSCYSC